MKNCWSAEVASNTTSEAEQEGEDRTVVAMFQVSRPLCKIQLSNAHDETSRCWPLAPAPERLCSTPQHSAARVILRLALALIVHCLRSVRPWWSPIKELEPWQIVGGREQKLRPRRNWLIPGDSHSYATCRECCKVMCVVRGEQLVRTAAPCTPGATNASTAVCACSKQWSEL